MEEPRKDPPPMRGLYGKAKIPVKVLDKIIIVGIIAMVIVLMMGLQNRGYTVSFDSMGGTPVESQLKMYSEFVDEPEAPTREGYVFSGWYQDRNLQYPWDMTANRVQQSMTLYASWEKATP